MLVGAVAGEDTRNLLDGSPSENPSSRETLVVHRLSDHNRDVDDLECNCTQVFSFVVASRERRGVAGVVLR